MENIIGGDDIFSRYKMPLLCLTHQRNYTVIVNISEISKALHRSQIIIIKFLSLNLGCGIKDNNRLNVFF